VRLMVKNSEGRRMSRTFLCTVKINEINFNAIKKGSEIKRQFGEKTIHELLLVRETVDQLTLHVILSDLFSSEHLEYLAWG
jgi:hypothetical protein